MFEGVGGHEMPMDALRKHFEIHSKLKPARQDTLHKIFYRKYYAIGM